MVRDEFPSLSVRGKTVMEQYTEEKFIGRGNYGSAHLIVHKATGVCALGRGCEPGIVSAAAASCRCCLSGSVCVYVILYAGACGLPRAR